jgi:CrcB protein
VSRLLLVCLGGALGTGLRYGVASLSAQWFGADFPVGTLVVNVVGSFAIGFVQHAAATVMLAEDVRLFLTAGVMGGLTTYSAFSYETVRLAQVGAWSRAVVNVVTTTVLCFAMCVAGMAAARAALSAR